jgi:two-component system response regulator AlgR
MAFSAVIIDDEPLAVEALRRLCERSGLVRIVGSASGGAAGLPLLAAQQPDAVFLDIGMPGMSGLEIARHLRTLARPPLVIFVTAYDHFATEAFDLSVVDYILKPLEPERLERAIERAAQVLAERAAVGGGQAAQDFWVPHGGSIVRVPAAAIKRIDAERDYVRLSVEQRSYLLREPLSAIEARLAPELFLRVHRSTIVRLDCVRELRHLGAGAWEVVDQDGRQARVGRSYLARVRAQLGLAALA